ncbi:MAG: phytanoyl-CoA dioxygenase family protein [Actinomycetota bacterium]
MAPTVADHVERLDDVGWTIVENAIDPALIDEIDEALERLETDLGIVPTANTFEGANTKRVFNLLAHEGPWPQVPTHPAIAPIIEGVLGEGFLISSLASVSIGPGEAAQPIHADDQMMRIAKPHFPTVCNTMWALTDFTDANGATRLVPGSHHWKTPKYREAVEAESIPAEMARGSVLVWTGSLWHGGGANRTDGWRTGIAMNYCAGFIRQQENQQLGVPPERMATFTPELRQMCGLGVYRGLIGNIDKKSPAELLYGDPPQTHLWDQDPI